MVHTLLLVTAQPAQLPKGLINAIQDLLPSAWLANLSPCSQDTFIPWARGQFLDLHARTMVSCGHGQPHIKYPTNEWGKESVTPSFHLCLQERFQGHGPCDFIQPSEEGHKAEEVHLTH